MKLIHILLITTLIATAPKKSEASDFYNATMAASSSSGGTDPMTAFITALGPSGAGTAIAIAVWQILKRAAPPVWSALQSCVGSCKERSLPPPYANFVNTHLSESPAKDALSLYLQLLNTANTRFQDTLGFSYEISANKIKYGTPRAVITCKRVDDGEDGFPAALPPHLEAKGMKKITGYMQSLLSPYGAKNVSKLLAEINDLYQTGRVSLSLTTEGDQNQFYTLRAYIPTVSTDDSEVPLTSYVIVETKMRRTAPQQAPLKIVVDDDLDEGADKVIALAIPKVPLPSPVSSSLESEDDSSPSLMIPVSTHYSNAHSSSRRQSVDGLDEDLGE